jgi:hypothetical protein
MVGQRELVFPECLISIEAALESHSIIISQRSIKPAQYNIRLFGRSITGHRLGVNQSRDKRGQRLFVHHSPQVRSRGVLVRVRIAVWYFVSVSTALKPLFTKWWSTH